MKAPEGRQVLSTHIDAELHKKVRIAAFKQKLALPAVCDEALKLWIAQSRANEKMEK